MTALGPLAVLLIPDHAQPHWQELQAQLGALTDPVPCADDPDAWQPESRADEEFADVAVQLCVRCPVLAACSAFADVAGERHGVWGGRDRRPTRGRARASAQRVAS